ncbi:MAG: RluA family pseudouridine synthase [Magnetococcales bacterium]|nr:RluA family pseudouridine synthase [Magnetococcales bacterium]
MQILVVERGEEPRSGVRKVVVGGGEAGMRLDRFLQRQWPGMPPSAIQRLMRTGQVRINGGRAKGPDRLAEGDEVRLPPVRPEEPSPEGRGRVVPEWAVAEVGRRILWEDEALLVMDKPAGVPVHGGSGQPWGWVDAVRLWWGAEREGIYGSAPELTHRLDRDTSGCLVMGLTPLAVRHLAGAFKAGAVEKRYLALVRGVPPPRGSIRQPLTKGVTRGGERMVVAAVDEPGDPAWTDFRVVRRFSGPWGEVSLVEAHPRSGRTHQIRVHLAWLGHPLAGDGKYGDRELDRRLKGVGMNRLFLHAARVAFAHPLTGHPVAVESPLPEALLRVLDGLAQGERA